MENDKLPLDSEKSPIISVINNFLSSSRTKNWIFKMAYIKKWNFWKCWVKCWTSGYSSSIRYAHVASTSSIACQIKAYI